MLAGQVEAVKDGEPADDPNDTVHIWDLAKNAAVFASAGPSDTSPAWVPDGSGIVFKTTPGGPRMQLATASPGGNRSYPITDAYQSLIVSCSGVWRGRNTLVFFEREKERGDFQVKAWDRDTKAISVLWVTPGQDAVVPTVSPGGDKLAYFDKAVEPRRLIVVDLKAKKVLFRSKPGAGTVTAHAWGHAPGRLFYATDTKKGAQLHRLTLSSGEDKVIASAEQFVTPIAVRPVADDVAIATVSASRAGPSLRIFDAYGKLLARSPGGLVAARPAWSPDGKRLAYCASADVLPRVRCGHCEPLFGLETLKMPAWHRPVSCDQPMLFVPARRDRRTGRGEAFAPLRSRKPGMVPRMFRLKAGRSSCGRSNRGHHRNRIDHAVGECFAPTDLPSVASVAGGTPLWATPALWGAKQVALFADTGGVFGVATDAPHSQPAQSAKWIADPSGSSFFASPLIAPTPGNASATAFLASTDGHLYLYDLTPDVNGNIRQVGNVLLSDGAHAPGPIRASMAA